MFRNVQFSLVICIIVLTNSCFLCRDRNKEFVNRYYSENFDSFSNITVYIRGFDSEHKPILFISNDSSSDGPYTVIIDSKTSKIISSNCHLMNDSNNIDRKALNKLAVKFLKYNVSYLDVDKYGNLFINFKIGEQPNLVRFSDKKYITETYKNEWKNIKGNWYEYK